MGTHFMTTTRPHPLVVFQPTPHLMILQTLASSTLALLQWTNLETAHSPAPVLQPIQLQLGLRSETDQRYWH